LHQRKRRKTRAPPLAQDVQVFWDKSKPIAGETQSRNLDGSFVRIFDENVFFESYLEKGRKESREYNKIIVLPWIYSVF